MVWFRIKDKPLRHSCRVKMSSDANVTFNVWSQLSKIKLKIISFNLLHQKSITSIWCLPILQYLPVSKIFYSFHFTSKIHLSGILGFYIAVNFLLSLSLTASLLLLRDKLAVSRIWQLSGLTKKPNITSHNIFEFLWYTDARINAVTIITVNCGYKARSDN